MAKTLIKLITIYQKTISPDHGLLSWRYPNGWCRFSPSCSEYAKEAIMKHGSRAGLKMAFKRVFRCNPWSQGGHDPVMGYKK